VPLTIKGLLALEPSCRECFYVTGIYVFHVRIVTVLGVNLLSREGYSQRGHRMGPQKIESLMERSWTWHYNY